MPGRAMLSTGAGGALLTTTGAAGLRGISNEAGARVAGGCLVAGALEQRRRV